MRRIYMDANATTPLLPEVVEAMTPFWIENFGNASSIHQQGQQARAAVEHARESVARLLHCRAAEIVFTSGGTESDNLAIFGTLKPGDHLITTVIEHHAVLHAAQALAERGVEVTLLSCDGEGVVPPSALREALRPNTRLVSIMLANNETGVLQPVAELAAISRAAGALFHTDAVQAAGKLPLNLSAKGELRDVDLLTISGHKMYAPQGTGILFVRRGVRLQAMLHGGAHERQRRAGTENVPGIVGLGKAAEMAETWLGEEPTSQMRDVGHPHSHPVLLGRLRDRLEQGILAAVEGAGVNGGSAARGVNTSNLYFDHVEAEALVIALDLKGLAVSGGSACQSGATEPSHVLTAMGLSASRARASVRFSLSRLTTEEEVDRAVALVAPAVARLRGLSPAWVKMEAAASVAARPAG